MLAPPDSHGWRIHGIQSLPHLPAMGGEYMGSRACPTCQPWVENTWDPGPVTCQPWVENTWDPEPAPPASHGWRIHGIQSLSPASHGWRIHGIQSLSPASHGWRIQGIQSLPHQRAMVREYMGSRACPTCQPWVENTWDPEPAPPASHGWRIHGIQGLPPPGSNGRGIDAWREPSACHSWVKTSKTEYEKKKITCNRAGIIINNANYILKKTKTTI